VYGIGHDVGSYRVFPTAILRKRPSRHFRSSTKMLAACCLRALVACCPLALFVISLTSCSADGMIRLYRNYDPATSSTDVQMVSAFRGLSEIISMRRGAGVVVDWKQAGGFLLVGGDSHIIRVWDAHTEAQLLVRGHSILAANQTLRNIYRI
jgi:WD40 repeat protein